MYMYVCQPEPANIEQKKKKKNLPKTKDHCFPSISLFILY